MNQSQSENSNIVTTIPTRSPMESIYSEDRDITVMQTETTVLPPHDQQQASPTWWQGDSQQMSLSSVSSPSIPHAPPSTAVTTTASTPTLLPANQGDDTNEPSPSSSEAENELRRKILDIQRNASISAKDKARQIQQLMWQGTRASPTNHTSCSGASNPSSSSEPINSEGYSVTYQDKKRAIMGCQHYQRKCKLQAHCCGKIFSCRFCHDEALSSSDHSIVRTDTKNMYCMLCETLQPVAQHCMNCEEPMARYYCDKCKLWDDAPSKSIYHCDDCGMCRQGQGLGKDFFHCAKCNICMSISMQDKHRCIERNLESDCPICGEYMFTSTATVIFMPCGHCIHKHCYTEYIQTSYQCPTCLKSLCDMSDYFARLDRELERQSMPTEYAKFISHVFCNDCERRCPAKYHFFYHKCAHCASYNTTVLRTENIEVPSSLPSTTTTTTTIMEDDPPSPSLSSPSSSPSSSQLSSSPTSPLDETTASDQLTMPDTGLDSSSIATARGLDSSTPTTDYLNGVGPSSQQLEEAII